MDFFKFRGLNEEHGAGDTGTSSLVAKYKTGTPGQTSPAPSRQPARKGDKLNAKMDYSSKIKQDDITVKNSMKEAFDDPEDEKNEDLDESATKGLAAKAKKSGISIGTLRKVYNRGMAAWNSGHRPGTTPQQWAMARVNSYIGKGKGTYHGADKDLREEVDGVKLLASSLRDPSSYDAIDQMMQTIAKKSGISPKELRDDFVKKHGKSPDDYAKGFAEAAVAKDKESGLPKQYVAGLSPSTAKARASHFNKADKLSDSNPAAYKSAPGDAKAETKPSKHTLKYRAMFGESVDEACWDGYKQLGTKKKGDRMVPNCVPAKEGVMKNIKRSIKGTDAESRAGDEATKMMKAQQAGNSAAASKYNSRYKKLAALTKKEDYSSAAQRKAVWASRNEKGIKEKLDSSQGAGEYVKDFQKSDAPQFKGKTKKERQKMAVAAYLSAKEDK